MGKYGTVTAKTVAELVKIAGEQAVIYGQAERMLNYAHDEVAGEEHAHMPDVVVKPETTAEVAAIMRLANYERIPVTPRGGGTGLSGGAVPVHGGIVLSTGHGSPAHRPAATDQGGF